MSDALSFRLKLVDQWTAPIKGANIATREFTSSVRELSTALKELERIKVPNLSVLARKIPRDPLDRKTRGNPQSVGIADPRATGEMQMTGLQVQKDAPAIAQQVAQADERAAAAQMKRAEAALKVAHLARAAEDANKLPLIPDAPGGQPTRIILSTSEIQRYKQMLRDAKLAVDGLSTSQRQLGQAASVDVGAYRLVSAELQRAKNRLGEIQRVMILSGNASRFGREGTNRLVTTLRELAEAAGGRGLGNLATSLGRLQMMGGGVKSLGSELSTMTGISTRAGVAVAGVGVAALGSVAGVMAATAAVAALTTGLSYLLIKGAAFAERASEAKVQTVAMLDALLGSAKAAKVTYVDIENLTRDYATTPDRLKEIATTLGTAGMRGTKMMRESLTMITQTESVLGGTAASKLQGILEEAAKPRFWGVASGSSEGVQRMQMNAKVLEGTGIRIQEVWREMSKRTGQHVDEIRQRMMMGLGVPSQFGIEVLSSVLEKKYGAAARRMTLTFSKQIINLKTNLTRMFSDVDATPFLEGLKSVVRLFDTTTYAGTAMKFMVEKLYNGFFEIASRAIPWVRAGLKGLVIVALELYVGFRPMLYQFGLISQKSEEGRKGLEGFMDQTIGFGKVVGKVSEDVGNLITKIDQLLERVTGGGIGSAMKFGAKTVFMGGPIAHVAEAQAALIEKAKGAGKQTGLGLSQGIRSTVPQLKEAVKELGNEALNTFKSIFKIASPSRVTEGFGMNLSLGLAKGIDRMAPVANDNMKRVIDMGAMDSFSTAPSGGVISSGSKGSSKAVIHVHFHERSIVIEGSGGSAEQMMDVLTERLPGVMADILEEAALEAGLQTGTG